MLVLGSANHRFVLDVLDYEDKASNDRQESNQLLVSIELEKDRKSSIVMGTWLATHELSVLGNWFGQIASGVTLPAVTLLEPGLSIGAAIENRSTFHITISMNATASPQWSSLQLSSEPCVITFTLNYQEMVQAAQQLQELHRRFPTQ